MRKRHLVEIALLFLYYAFYSYGFFVVGDADKHLSLVTRYVCLFIISVPVILIIALKLKGQRVNSIGFFLTMIASIIVLTMALIWLLREESYPLFAFEAILLFGWLDLAMQFKKLSELKKK